MENIDVRRSRKWRLTTIGALAFAAVAANAIAQQSGGYITDQSGAVWKNGFGSCWQTGSWTTASASEECDPDLVPKKAAPAKAPPPRATSPKPAPRAPAPRAVAPKLVAQKATLSADALFDFNQSSLKPAGKAKLDELISSMKAISIDGIIAVGHTDRIGSDAYNLKLSQRRAESVKAYLVSHGVPANRISTDGKGKKDPVTKPGACKGPKSKKVIDCLQPDRRVVIEVIGTRAQ